jgi:hypothetical protein
MCNSGGVTNGYKAVGFHFQPWDNTEFNITRLDEAIRLLKEEEAGLRALLVGGYRRDPESVCLKEKLLALFAKHGIEYSQFWGQDSGKYNWDGWYTDWSYDTRHDTWRLYTRKFSQPTLEVTHADDLPQAFKEIKVSPGDELIIEPEALKKSGWSRMPERFLWIARKIFSS